MVSATVVNWMKIESEIKELKIKKFEVSINFLSANKAGHTYSSLQMVQKRLIN